MVHKNKGRDTGDVATLKADQLGGVICSQITNSACDLQVAHLRRQFGLATPTAIAYALLAYGEVQS